MNRHEICNRLAGGDYMRLANMIGIRRHAIYQWPDPLPDRLIQRAVGAYVLDGGSLEALGDLRKAPHG